MVDFSRQSELTKAARADMDESHKEYTDAEKRAFTSGFIGVAEDATEHQGGLSDGS